MMSQSPWRRRRGHRKIDENVSSHIRFYAFAASGHEGTVHAACIQRLRALLLARSHLSAPDSRMLCKRYRIVSYMPSSMRFFRGNALRVTNKYSRRVVRGHAHGPQPDGWTQAGIEAERRVREGEKAKITLPSPAHLKRIMRDARLSRRSLRTALPQNERPAVAAGLRQNLPN
jgi:hypothetical protein